MNRVGLVRTLGSYGDLAAPFAPGVAYPELTRLANAGGAFEAASGRNHVYAAVREALHALGLDADHFASDVWNPLGDFVRPGAKIVLKPNFIRHWNPLEEEAGSPASVQSVITHGSVLRAMADYAMLAAGPEGEVIVAEAPQQDCDFDRIREIAGLDELTAHGEACGHRISVIDLRREAVVFDGGIIVERKALPGDPRGYRAVDLGRKSFFEGSGLDPNRFRGADYDPGPTAEHHKEGRNEYLLSETVLSADLIVNLPKLKTHKKTGVTLALKNLVGINGDKNWLPHHCVGSPDHGRRRVPGTERGWTDKLRSSKLTEIARPLLHRPGSGHRPLPLLPCAWSRERDARRRLHPRGQLVRQPTPPGACACDLNHLPSTTAIARGPRPRNAEAPVRTVLTVMDGVVAGEGAGPLAPSDRSARRAMRGQAPIPLALDLGGGGASWASTPSCIPKLRAAARGIRERALRVIREPAEVEVASSSVEVRAAVNRGEDATFVTSKARRGLLLERPRCPSGVAGAHRAA